ncbi:MAG TPA: RHS repeat domain-containing protein [Fimbriimonadales bacterium]|nr:RHS repeat domain-containing protein [Fimbriimonadales bacterium]
MISYERLVNLPKYDYDANGRLDLVNDPTSWASYTYDPRGRMTRETFSNGVYSQYGYDWASRLTSLNHKKSADNSVILGYSATYDNANRLLTSTELRWPLFLERCQPCDNQLRMVDDGPPSNL